jgi:hypothetical protein
MQNRAVGLGTLDAKIIFYIRNCPPLAQYQNLTSVKALVADEIADISRETGNHWRKIFNVYAKLLFEISSAQFTSWQHLRDSLLLQAESDHCLLFSAPDFSGADFSGADCSGADLLSAKPSQKLHIILGKGYAEQLGLCNGCIWLSHDFAINIDLGVIICPYFDYRQLSNKKITQLSGLIHQLTAHQLQSKVDG